MKNFIVPLICLSVVIAIVIAKRHPDKKVFWLNENIYYTTNLVMDTERNKTLPTNSQQVYVFPIVSTNRVNPLYFLIDGKVSELGGRDDGVIVWRKATNR